MASGGSQQGKGRREARHGSRPQNLANTNPGRSGHRQQGSVSSGSRDQWSTVHDWHSMHPWSMANAWGYPPSMIPPQTQWGMGYGWSPMDPLAVIQESMSSGSGQQWQTNPGSSDSGIGDQRSMRAWSSQESSHS
eukprot:4886285-Amphidinium_carterae.1